MGSRVGLAVLLLLGAVGVLALVGVAWFYSSLLQPGSGLPEGGCGFLVVCGALFVGFLGGAIWLLRQDD